MRAKLKHKIKYGDFWKRQELAAGTEGEILYETTDNKELNVGFEINGKIKHILVSKDVCDVHKN